MMNNRILNSINLLKHFEAIEQIDNKNNFFTMKYLNSIIICLMWVIVGCSNGTENESPTTDDDTLHLEFAGIPITGSITDFQKKIIDKGFEINNSPEARNAPLGIKGFIGSLSGIDAEVVVYYSPEVQDLVYSVNAYILCYSREDAFNKYKYFITKTTRQYPYFIPEEESEYSTTFLIAQPKGEEPQEGDPALGIISISVIIGKATDQYYIKISYSDMDGFLKVNPME